MKWIGRELVEFTSLLSIQYFNLHCNLFKASHGQILTSGYQIEKRLGVNRPPEILMSQEWEKIEVKYTLFWFVIFCRSLVCSVLICLWKWVGGRRRKRREECKWHDSDWHKTDSTHYWLQLLGQTQNSKMISNQIAGLYFAGKVAQSWANNALMYPTA